MKQREALGLVAALGLCFSPLSRAGDDLCMARAFGSMGARAKKAKKLLAEGRPLLQVGYDPKLSEEDLARAILDPAYPTNDVSYTAWKQAYEWEKGYRPQVAAALEARLGEYTDSALTSYLKNLSSEERQYFRGGQLSEDGFRKRLERYLTRTDMPARVQEASRQILGDFPRAKAMRPVRALREFEQESREVLSEVMRDDAAIGYSTAIADEELRAARLLEHPTERTRANYARLQVLEETEPSRFVRGAAQRKLDELIPMRPILREAGNDLARPFLGRHKADLVDMDFGNKLRLRLEAADVYSDLYKWAPARRIEIQNIAAKVVKAYPYTPQELELLELAKRLDFRLSRIEKEVELLMGPRRNEIIESLRKGSAHYGKWQGDGSENAELLGEFRKRLLDSLRYVERSEPEVQGIRPYVNQGLVKPRAKPELPSQRTHRPAARQSR